ncbi:D-glycerate dehydrogenase [Terrimonas sp. NA20]|uniref:D-glycerate dehydrogenase n=1 Tax=Terrimonas ginsenosidimutans TaxID=2908004 RepID=A0ABS9KYU5_9BACT|nr:D-glycerate dehydrogenase [Terrimonas ginsenosidimutans]MCG2617515.1 D-glycerate dehydrogenase [Terrimonas ginsenosidimutans]
MKVFISRAIPEIATELMEKAGLTVTQFPDRRNMSRRELIDACLQHDALLSVGHEHLDKEFLEACSHLKVISLYSVGFDKIDVAEATRLGIPVGNTPGVLSAATADTAFLLMLAASRKAFYQHKKILNGQWNYYDPTADLGIELYGKTIGIFGLGKIGFEMAKRCKGAYDMKVIYHNRSANPEAERELGATWVSFEELLSQSDVLSVHTALTPETKDKFDKTAFSKMRSNAIFVNTARGGIHNEAALKDALESGTIWGAGLDVTNPEPMAADNPLLQLPNTAILPHIGSATVEAREGMARRAAENVIAGLKGDSLPYPVNPEVKVR